MSSNSTETADELKSILRGSILNIGSTYKMPKTKSFRFSDCPVPNYKNRTYGFKYVHQSGTPFPREQSAIDMDQVSAILARKSTASGQEDYEFIGGKYYMERTTSDSSAKTIILTPDSVIERRETLTFAEQRRRFDEGEYTITRGRTLSDVVPSSKMTVASCENEASYAAQRNRSIQEHAAMCRFAESQNFTINNNNNNDN